MDGDDEENGRARQWAFDEFYCVATVGGGVWVGINPVPVKISGCDASGFPHRSLRWGVNGTKYRY